MSVGVMPLTFNIRYSYLRTQQLNVKIKWQIFHCVRSGCKKIGDAFRVSLVIVRFDRNGLRGNVIFNMKYVQISIE